MMSSFPFLLMCTIYFLFLCLRQMLFVLVSLAEEQMRGSACKYRWVDWGFVRGRARWAAGSGQQCRQQGRMSA